MSRLTRRDVAEVTAEVVPDIVYAIVDNVFDEKIDRKLGFFIEHMDDKFDSLNEAISLVSTNMGKLAKASDLKVMRQDITTIKLAVKETNKDLHRLEDRFDRFELSQV